MLRTSLLALLLAAPALAQGGGFTSHDLLLYSNAIQGISSTSNALVLVDLAAGTSSILVDTVGINGHGGACFDPYRQRVVFAANLGAPGAALRLWATDAAGQLDDLGFSGNVFRNMAPTGDGRIYLSDGNAVPFKYLDATNVLHTLLDAAGAAPFLLDGNPTADVRGMVHDAGTNALFVASGVLTCPGGSSNRVNVRKLPLSADGTRVVGPVGCAQFEVSASGETPVGLSRGPAGQLILVVDTNSSGVEPRILQVDPVTLGITVFASPGGFFGDPAINAGTYVPSTGQAVLLETLTDVLRAYSAGSSGAGSTLALTGTPVSAAGSSGEEATLLAVAPSACTGGWMAYGAGLAGSGAFVPTLAGGGCPQPGGGFTLQLAQGLGGATGLLFAGLAPAAVPLKGGTFLVGAVVVQVGIGLGGAAGVPGAGSLTLPAGLPADPALSGLDVYLQAGFQDAGAVKGVSLTQGVRMEIG